MSIRLNIYEKSPFEGLGEEILEGGSFSLGIVDELKTFKTANKHEINCITQSNWEGCFTCDCSDRDYIKITYEQLLKIDREVLSKNTNIIAAFCFERDNCNLDKQCELDCLKENHRECIWVNFC